MRHLALLCIACTTSISFADTTYLGLYLQGKKIGYSSYQTSPTTLNSKSALRSESKTVVDAGLMGSEMSVTIDSATWTSRSGSPLKMTFDTQSGGRSEKVKASFTKNSVILDIENGGIKTHRTLPVPVGVQVVDDPLTLFLGKHLPNGTSKTFLVLDPMTASLMKNRVQFLGPKGTEINGKRITADLIRIVDPRATTEVYVNKKGDILRVNAPMGITMLPVSRRIALTRDRRYQPSTDLSLSTSLKANKEIDSPDELTKLTLNIVCDTISDVPSDGFQTSTKSPHGWKISIHPPRLGGNKGRTILEAGAAKPTWVQPSLNMPSESPGFKQLAKQIVGARKDVESAAIAIQSYVYLNMKPNAGIGVLRDATEVLASKEGVCRDYATLTVTLLRSAGIPARLASGLVNWDGTFYYHAWAEAWDGTRWLGIDSTTDRPQISAAHVKLSDGNVETAFSFSFLEKAKIEVLEARKD